MFSKHFIKLLLATFFVNSFLFGDQELLKPQDVDRIMHQILQQHVDKKEMTNSIIKKSFQIYIDQFDPERIYLTESEVRPYMQMSDSQSVAIMDQYRRKDFSAYEKLNQLLQSAVVRAQSYRAILEHDPSVFNDLRSKTSPAEDWNDPDYKIPFAEDTEDLKARIKAHFIKFIDAERRRYGQAQVLKNESQLLNFYEKETRNHEDQYMAVDSAGHPVKPEVKENLLVMHILKSLAASLDAHTTFFNPAEAYDMKVRLEKEFEGIGITMQEKTDGIYVTALVAGGPAAKSGLIKINDRVLEIDGKPITGEAFETVMDLVRGKNGSPISLVLKRQVDENGHKVSKQFQVNLKREEITVDDERVDSSYEKFGNGIIGKLTLHSFYQSDKGISSEKDMRDAIKKLQEVGNLRGLVIDLRENSGGFLNQAVKVAGLFISNGIVVISKYSNGEEKFYRDMDSNRIYDGPLVILTSKATASAAEIVAQALQDYGIALIVGDEHTYGKGTIQSQTVTDNHGGSYFKVTVGKYYTVSGKTPQITGVKADIVVPSQFNREHIGEEYLEYPLHPDTIPPAYNDPLTDIDPSIRDWYLRYYTPNVQHKKEIWEAMVPVLKKNSAYRILHNKNYQMFLKHLNGDKVAADTAAAPDDEDDQADGLKIKKNFGANDLQMAEAVNIVKDMVYLQSHSRHSPKEAIGSVK